MKIIRRQKRLPDPRITKTVRGYSGPSWEFSVTGRASFVNKMMKKYVPEIQRIAASLAVAGTNPAPERTNTKC